MIQKEKVKKHLKEKGLEAGPEYLQALGALVLAIVEESARRAVASGSKEVKTEHLPPPPARQPETVSIRRGQYVPPRAQIIRTRVEVHGSGALIARREV